MFQYASGSDDIIEGMFKEMAGNHLEIVLADRDETVYFTSTHVADMKAVIDAESRENGENDVDNLVPDNVGSETD
jgi:hypothetical protein